ncbi:MAG: ribosome maturation factor RimM [Ignavibacteriaceae bacterium]
MTDYFLVAKIHSVYGRHGFVRITSFSDFPERFYALKKVYINFFGVKKEFLVEEVKNVKDFFIIKFKNFNDEKEAGILVNKELYVDNSNLVKLPEDYFFIHDLIGSIVLKNNVEIGKITDILSLPANDVYVIIDKQGKEILIPAVNEFIENFDSEKKILILMPGKDLYEDED